MSGELHQIDALELGWTRGRHGEWTRMLGTVGSAVVKAELRRCRSGWAATVIVVGEQRARRLYSSDPLHPHANLSRAKRVAVLAYRGFAAALERVAARKAAPTSAPSFVGLAARLPDGEG